MKSKVISFKEECVINFDYVTRVYKKESYVVVDFVNNTSVEIPCDEWELENVYNLYLNIMDSSKVGNLLKKYNKKYDKHIKENKKKKDLI